MTEKVSVDVRRTRILVFSIFPTQSIALTCLAVAIVAASGLLLGAIPIKGFKLGIPGVMFTGLVCGRLLGVGSLTGWIGKEPGLSGPMVNFVRDFGLILFVYAVGVQVGPGFLSTLRKRGLPLNLMAVTVVLLGATTAIVLASATGTDLRAAVGLFAGGTTNAPALASAEGALKSVHGAVAGAEDLGKVTSPAFAIAYPFGLIGVILAMVLLRAIFRASPSAEAAEIEKADRAGARELATLNIEVANPNLDGVLMKDLPALDKTSVVVSRLHHRGKVTIPTPETKVHTGDVLLAVGEPEEVRELQMIVGRPATVDLRVLGDRITTRQVLVTHREVLGKTVDELDLPRTTGVAVTRVFRAGLEFTAVKRLRLQFGDRVRIVGEAASIEAGAKKLGDSTRELNHPRLLPIFVGIALGVFVGSIPVVVPGLPAPVKLGLAAGPMIVAIVLAQLGRVGSLIWYMPQSASGLLRELGIVMFLIAVGINGGHGFFSKVGSPEGLYWLGCGAVITLLPLLAVGAFARVVLKTNFLHICGLLCGSMTSPSLAFVHTFTPSEAPAVAFATVYPLSMILRVLTAQLLVLIFVH